MFVVQRRRLVRIELGFHVRCRTIIPLDLRCRNFQSLPYVVKCDPSFDAEGCLPSTSEFRSPIRGQGVLFHEIEL